MEINKSYVTQVSLFASESWMLNIVQHTSERSGSSQLPCNVTDNSIMSTGNITMSSGNRTMSIGNSTMFTENRTMSTGKNTMSTGNSTDCFN